MRRRTLGISLTLIVILLAFGLFSTFRPDSNAYVDKMSPRF